MDVFQHGTIYYKALGTSWNPDDTIFVGSSSRVNLFCTLSGTAPTSYRLRILHYNKAGIGFPEDCFDEEGDGRLDHEEKYVYVPGSRTQAMMSIQVPEWSVIAVDACRIGGDGTTTLLVTGEAHPPET